jgi:hypothetical protein
VARLTEFYRDLGAPGFDGPNPEHSGLRPQI